MVKINKTLKKEIKSTIKANFKRYLSLIIIIFLGTAFYVGMKINSSILQNTMSNYFEEYNYADIRIASEIGLTSEELNKLKQAVPNIESIEGKYFKDVVVELTNKETGETTGYAVSVNSYNPNNKTNKLKLLQGRNIQNKYECVLDASAVGLGYKLGDTIVINDDVLDNSRYTIVGFARDPQYISVDRGSTNLLDGRINYFAYVDESNFKVSDDLYMIADITIKNKYKAFTNEYNKYLDDTKKEISEKSAKIAEKRETEIINKSNEQLKQIEEEYEKQKNDIVDKLVQVGTMLNQAEVQLDAAEEKVLTDNEVDIYLYALRLNLESSRSQLDSLRNTIEIVQSVLKTVSDSGINSINVDLTSLKTKLNNLNTTLQETKNTITELQNELTNKQTECEGINDQELANACNSAADVIKERIETYKFKLDTITSEINQIKGLINLAEKYTSGNTGNVDIAQYINYFDGLEDSYNDAVKKYNDAVEVYNDARVNLRPQMAAARQIIKEKKALLALAKEQFELGKKEAVDSLETAYDQIIAAKKLVKSLENLSWKVFTRNDSNGYSSYYDDTLRIDNLGKVLPFIFFVVASLVTMTSITRMVQEERRKIGILKSLGYDKKQITRKYTFYTLSADIIGLILGIIFGLLIFPNVVYKVYSLQYFLPNLIYEFDIKHIIFATVLSLASTMIVEHLAVKSILKEKPAELMRKKKIKTGRVSILEKNKRLWKRLPFTKKVAYRSIFLSFGRSIMTIIGILGCTALIITSYGLRESMKNIVSLQYNKILNVSTEFFYKQELTQYEIQNDFERISNLSYVDKASLNRLETTNVKINNKVHSIYTFIPDNITNFNTNINLYSAITGQRIDLSKTDGVVISEKLAKLLNVSKGDVITFTDGSNISHKAKIADISENYIAHYMFMNKDTYLKTYGYTPKNNVLLAKYSQKNYNIITDKIYSNDNYSNFISIAALKDEANDIVQRFDIIVYIIIISAALLAFVVLYNLAKINISERQTEVATLKVLGYNSKQINKYINHETNILTFIGIVTGLFGGYFLTDIVITICELDNIMFYHGITYISYAYGVILTIVFSKAINFLVRKDLKKISMTESFELSE